MANPRVLLDGSPLRPEDVLRVARADVPVEFEAGARARVADCRRALESVLSDGESHYGVNTGFGSLSRQRVDGPQLRDLQRNLVRSHAAGVGEPLPRDSVRAMMLVLAASLARARSGVRPEVIDGIAAMLNAGVTPVVPESGSVGASGDLAPLAHVALVLIGEGEAFVGDRRVAGSEAWTDVIKSQPVALEAKEGLALINGTHLMCGRLALILADADRLFNAALVAAAMSIDGIRGTDAPLDPRITEARAQPGPERAARAIRALMDGSEIIASHRHNDPRVQDPYSLRCAHLVIGAAGSWLEQARHALVHELGAVTDNPLVFQGEDGASILSGGNFHGIPVAIPLDVLAIALSHIAGISERRTYYMLSAVDVESHLNPFLSQQPGLHSGFMIAQYTAAAMCNELIGLANPASVANISTSAGIEDYNSFGPRSAAKAARGIELASRVIAIELMCGAQAIEAHRPLKTGARLEQAHALIRERVAPLTDDRPLTEDIEGLAGLALSGAFDPLIVD